MQKEFLRITEAAQILGIAKTSAYAAAKNGQIPSIRIGKLRLVPKAAIEKMLAGETCNRGVVKEK